MRIVHLVEYEWIDPKAAHPRNVLVGHVVGVAAGWIALLVTGRL